MTMLFTIVGKGGFSRLFADDTSLLYSSNNINEIEVIINSDLCKIYNWSKEWLVDFNPKKTECIIFSTNQAANKPCIVFNNENVKFVENHKHLGVTFSHNCKWHCHIENILKSTSSQLSMLRKFKFSLSRHNLEAIYFTYILRLIGCLVSRKNNTFCFLWVKVNEPFF
jgi:hypothetical protein